MILHIRNMKGRCCIGIVTGVLEKLGISYKHVGLGEAGITGKISKDNFILMDNALRKSGLILFNNNDIQVVEKIIKAVNTTIYSTNESSRQHLATFIKKQVDSKFSYFSLGRIFYRIEGITIEKYLIKQRIERVKQLLINERNTPKEISQIMFFSSVSHLYSQFKKITGITPVRYRQNNEKRILKAAFKKTEKN